MTGYYDIVLGLIPLALLGISGGLYVAGFAVPTAVSIAGLVAVTLVGHALFVRAPTDPTPVARDNAPVNAD
ncbi:hypothetical protein [Halomarina rubra]|uniref:Uncharacterized protein n=1 Tax=Halomarina rubra TaxID=2071873 RepID=A0ABD6AUG3_9EURY|nr:hypothetical protein [Halomarina rubra]